jgi:hypothetical protein
MAQVKLEKWTSVSPCPVVVLDTPSVLVVRPKNALGSQG